MDDDAVVTSDPMVAFLYLLLAEELPYNRVAKLVDRVGWLSDVPDGAFRLDARPLAEAALEARAKLSPAVRIYRHTGPISQEDVDDLFGGVVPEGRWIVEPGGCSKCRQQGHTTAWHEAHYSEGERLDEALAIGEV